ncbi:MAG: hypothetical protein FWC61_04815 [Proteobacteria bacterium]|nr:hypothetical protein [Pseudomonadota bacterium]
MNTFFKIGFFVLLAVVIAGGWVFVKANPMKNTGAASWTDFYSSDPAATMKFLNDNFGITAEQSKESADNMVYYVLKAKGQMWPFAGITDVPMLPDGTKVNQHTTVYLTVKDYAAMHQKMLAAGATAVVADKFAGGMKFGIYTIPGGITIGIAQYENAKK